MSMATTTETVVGVFTNRRNADQAIQDLYNAGFGSNQIGFVAKNAERSQVTSTTDTESSTAAGAMTGAAVGAIGGAAVGAGIAAGAIPVIGPVLAIGTLGTVLLNAAGGAAAVGLAGALAGWGVSDEDAEYYESEVNKGKYLVTVESSDRLSEAQSILQRHGATARREWKNEPMGA